MEEVKATELTYECDHRSHAIYFRGQKIVRVAENIHTKITPVNLLFQNQAAKRTIKSILDGSPPSHVLKIIEEIQGIV